MAGVRYAAVSARRWTIELDGRRHDIVLDHGYFSARRRVIVDGSTVVDIRPNPLDAVRMWNTATEHPFAIAGHACAVRIDPTVDNMTYKKFLIVDGQDADHGTSLEPLPETPTGGREGRWLAGYGGIGGALLTLLGAIVIAVLMRFFANR